MFTDSVIEGVRTGYTAERKEMHFNIDSKIVSGN